MRLTQGWGPEENTVEDDRLQEKLDELVKEFGPNTNPQTQKLAELAKQARESQQKLRKSLDGLQEALDYLRVCIKYQAFDLEATRRENDYLKKILEDRNAKE
jgi:hypothetical protein